MKTRGALGLALVLLLGSSGASGCRSNDVVLLDLPADAGHGGGGGSLASSGAASSAGTSGVTSTSGGAGGASAGAGGVRSNAGTNPAGGAGGGPGGTSARAGNSGDSGNSGRSGTTAGTRGAGECFDNGDCPSGWVCEKPGCSAQSGQCVDGSFVFCPPLGAPVCGCDNVTYWNDCVRRRYGARKAADGECGMVISCRSGADCGVEGAVCAHLLWPRQPCDGRDDPGKCWVLPEPENCEGPSMMRYGACPPPPPTPGAPGLFPCVDLCTAIRSEKPQILLPRDLSCDEQ
jgi:hypothetical protein